MEFEEETSNSSSMEIKFDAPAEPFMVPVHCLTE
jgi:hypothetical protein